MPTAPCLAGRAPAARGASNARLRSGLDNIPGPQPPPHSCRPAASLPAEHPRPGLSQGSFLWALSAAASHGARGGRSPLKDPLPFCTAGLLFLGGGGGGILHEGSGAAAKLTVFSRTHPCLTPGCHKAEPCQSTLPGSPSTRSTCAPLRQPGTEMQSLPQRCWPPTLAPAWAPFSAVPGRRHERNAGAGPRQARGEPPRHPPRQQSWPSLRRVSLGVQAWREHLAPEGARQSAPTRAALARGEAQGRTGTAPAHPRQTTAQPQARPFHMLPSQAAQGNWSGSEGSGEGGQGQMHPLVRQRAARPLSAVQLE